MKKSYLLALGCALMAGTAVAQNAQEVTYVEDPAQGYIFNKFADNWFIQAEGGVTVGFSDADIHSSFWKRLAPGANLYVGKWFSPVLAANGCRLRASFTLKTLLSAHSPGKVFRTSTPTKLKSTTSVVLST